jgi:hypothetical protein
MPIGGKRFLRDRAAKAIAESVTFGIQATCAKYKISRRTLERWKKRLDTGDKELSQLVADRLEDTNAAWMAVIPGALTECFGFITRAAKEADHRDPDAIHSIVGAAKILTDIVNARQLLAEGLLGGQHQQDSSAAVAGSAAREASRADATPADGSVAH